MVNLKNISCILKAIPFFLKTGNWIPHLWIEKATYPGVDIWVSDRTGFRVRGNGYEHYPWEHLEKNVTLHGLECKHCGKKMMTWDKGDVIQLPKGEEG